MQIVILGGSLYSKNRGINALTRSTMDILKSLNIKSGIILSGFGAGFIKVFDDYTFVPLPRFSKILKLYIISFINKKAIFLELLGTTKSNDKILILDLSGGDSFTDTYGYQRYIYQIGIKYLFKRLSYNYILLPQTIGPFNNKLVEHFSKLFLKNVRIMVRDNDSKEYVSQLVMRDCTFCHDLAFTLAPKKNSNINMDCSKRIGVNVSGLLWIGGYNRNNQFNLKVNYQELMIDISEYFLKQGWKMVLIPHTYGDIEEDDLKACRVLGDILRDKGYEIDLIDMDLTEQEIKDIISKFEFFLGSRMHSCIAALSSNVPAMGVSYSRKFRGIFKTINADIFLLDPQLMSKEEMMDHLDYCFKNREDLREKLRILMPQVHSSIINTMKEELDLAIK